MDDVGRVVRTAHDAVAHARDRLTAVLEDQERLAADQTALTDVLVELATEVQPVKVMARAESDHEEQIATTLMWLYALPDEPFTKDTVGRAFEYLGRLLDPQHRAILSEYDLLLQARTRLTAAIETWERLEADENLLEDVLAELATNLQPVWDQWVALGKSDRSLGDTVTSMFTLYESASEGFTLHTLGHAEGILHRICSDLVDYLAMASPSIDR